MTIAKAESPFRARGRLRVAGQPFAFFPLADAGAAERLPFSIKVVLESLVRHCDGRLVSPADVGRLAAWQPQAPAAAELPFMPARVILQDFTGVPCVVDLAAMRDAVRRLGGSPAAINPLVPVDLVIDHSVQVDVYGSRLALFKNAEYEFARNRERYEFLRWGQSAFRNFRVVPPATGIVHQVNLEYLASVVTTRPGGSGERSPSPIRWSARTRTPP